LIVEVFVSIALFNVAIGFSSRNLYILLVFGIVISAMFTLLIRYNYLARDMQFSKLRFFASYIVFLIAACLALTFSVMAGGI
jgi:hypothetical protein